MSIIIYPSEAPQNKKSLVVVHPSDQAKEINPAVNYILSLQSKLSRATMRSNLNKVALLLGYESMLVAPWEKLRRSHVQAIINKLSEQGLSSSTVNTYLSAIKGVALEAWMANLITAHDHSMIKQVKSLRGKKVRQGNALSQENVIKLLNIDLSTPIGVRNLAIFSLMIGCGLRRAEVVALNVANLNKEDGRIIIKGKGNKERVMYVPENTLENIKNWIKLAHLSAENPIFTRIFKSHVITTKRLSSQAIYLFMQAQQAKAGLSGLSPHDLRRTFATILLKKGEDLITVKEAMGHSSVETTQKYDMRGEERLKQASSHFDWL